MFAVLRRLVASIGGAHYALVDYRAVDVEGLGFHVAVIELDEDSADAGRFIDQIARFAGVVHTLRDTLETRQSGYASGKFQFLENKTTEPNQAPQRIARNVTNCSASFSGLSLSLSVRQVGH